MLDWLKRIVSKLLSWFRKVDPENKPINPSDPPWLEAAFDEIGVEEIPGSEHNDRIVWYHSYCDGGFDTDEISWCSSFVNAMVSVGTGGKIEGTKSAAARSWLKWGKPVLDEPPQRGDIAVFWRVAINDWRGHVGFVWDITNNGQIVHVLGGNQGNRVCIQKYSRDKLLGYRRAITDALHK